MADPVFDLDAFRQAYPQFDPVPDEAVLPTSEAALCLVSQDGSCDCDPLMWRLMVAHMLALQQAAESGNGAGGPVTAASIDKVSVTFAAPPVGTSAYKCWLFKTPYGSQIAAMLARCAAGGVYVGGLPERSAFRSVGGIFPGRSRWLR